MIRTFGWHEFLFILDAAQWTLALSLIAFIGGAHRRPGRRAGAHLRQSSGCARSATGFIQVFQGTPLLLQLFLIFFGAPVLGFDINPGSPPALALMLNASAFLGEIWRGCIEAIPRGQWEAAEALGLHYATACATWCCRRPSRSPWPPTVGYMVQVIKGTSLAAIIGFTEVTRAGQIINNATFQPLHRLQRSWRRSTSCCAGRCRCWRRGWSAATPPRSRALNASSASSTSSRHRRTSMTHVRSTPLRRHRRRCASACAAAFGCRRAGAGPDASTSIKKKGELTVGMLVDFPPYGTTNAQNQPDGYDADVAQLLAKEWASRSNLVPVTGPNRIPFLLTNKVDLLVASLAITPERAKQVQFSKPYAAATIVLLRAARRPTIKSAGRPEGPARRRGPRQHAGHRR